MKRRGRPLRFLGAIAFCWVAVRVALLWPGGEVVPVASIDAPSLPSLALGDVTAVTAFERAIPPAFVQAVAGPGPVYAVLTALPSPVARRAADPMRVELALLNLLQFGEPEYLDGGMVQPVATAAAFGPAVQQRRVEPAAGRWSGSAWLVARPGTGIGAAPDGSQLGGSQAGVRLGWMLDPGRRVALYGRVSAPLRGKGREGALGVEWQPLDAPVRLIAERRFGLDGQRGGTGIGLVAGVDRSLAAGFALESYGQAGAVKRDRIEPYADGAARAVREVARQGPVRLSLGVGAWGAAQRDGQRLDLGPVAAARLPLAGTQMRVALDWRQRVAGRARPGSGLALTIGSDF